MPQKQVYPGPKKEETAEPQDTKKKPTATPPKEEDAVAKIIKTVSKNSEDLDKLLDEIDNVLEENAEEFVRSYVQRGGE